MSFLPLYKHLSLWKSAFENLLEIMIKYTYIFRSGGIKECFGLENMSCIEISEFVERLPELSLFYRLFSQLDSEMICIFPYFCPYAESAREIRKIFC